MTKPTIGARLEAFWLAWKYVVILLALLGLSLWGNLHQYVASKTAPLRAEVTSKQAALDTSADLLAGSLQSAAALGDAARRATANLTESSDAYRSAARLHPLPANCAPGQGRQDAVNRAMGATNPPEKTR